MPLFNEYKMKTKKIMNSPDKLRNIILDLDSFFRCAEYQTEKEAYYWKMATLFNRISAALLPLMAPAREVSGWGELEL